MAQVTRHLRVEVPVRVCDVGGWTDTWFAERGSVCSLAVEPGVSVQVEAGPGAGRVAITLVEFDLTFTVGSEPAEHRLLAEAVRESGGPGGHDVSLVVASAVPPGSSLGTSAAVCVGVIAALAAVRGEVRSPGDLAVAAHGVEVERLGRQSGVQDQLAAAHGGANLIEIATYPSGQVRPLGLPPGVADQLDERLVHVAYGDAHDSSAVHEEVIARLTAEGSGGASLERLRGLAAEAAETLEAGDLERYARVLTAATEAQAALHPALISSDAAALIDAARAAGAAGWKVNGAGGAGGSLSILCRSSTDRDDLAELVASGGWTPMALRLARGGARVTSVRS